MSNPRPRLPLGRFATSLAVENLDASLAFYRALGFVKIDGSDAERWAYLRNGDTRIGLYEDRFDANFLTFMLDAGDPEHPPLDAVADHLESAGIPIEARDATDDGAAFILVRDPDDNAVHIAEYPTP